MWRNGPLLLAATMLFWAGNSIAGRALAGVTPPITLAFWRWTLALLLVTPLALPHLRTDGAVLVQRWRTVLALSVTGVASFGALLYVGLHQTTALNSLLMQAAIPPLILLFAWVALRERTTRWQIGGVALSLLGVLVVVSHGRPWDLLHLDLNRGDGIIFLGVVLYAVYSLILRRRPPVHPFSLLWATFLTSMVLLGPLYGWEFAGGARIHLTAPAMLGIGYVALFPSFLAYLFFNRGVELLGPGSAGHFLHLQPFFGAILAVTVLGEAFRPFHAAGLLLIAAGIGLSSFVAARLSRPPPGSP
ncbi:DMT family transporter [Phenylobacterium deserti]|uniref:EamA/RhaT family transporter n=1 Tax=Phenylobacterium deserti TaxID=1914756 RepID=A0A328APD7_9CAUL|nr:DMT family transporter [Phenylobacterium deserti]RAK56862.1 EamA/RhaT family transporter [Phenylobacterium deserti]